MNQINFKMIGKKTHGGARANAGAPRKSETEQSNIIFITAIKELKKLNNDNDAKKAFVKDLLDFERGKMFIAEHLFGKPLQIIEQTNITPITEIVLIDATITNTNS